MRVCHGFLPTPAPRVWMNEARLNWAWSYESDLHNEIVKPIGFRMQQ